MSLKETTLSNGNLLREFTKYPYDYFAGAPASSSDSRANGLYLLCNKNMVDVPIEVVSSIKRPGETNYVTTASRLYTFKSNSLTNNPVLAERLSLALSSPVSNYVTTSISSGVFIFDSRFFRKAEYLSYNSSDALLQLDDNKGFTQFEWGFNNSLVTGIIDDPGGFHRRTTYLHRPLVGLLEIGDPNSNTTSYSYDSHNRLASISDDAGNIMSTYEYHLKDELSTTMLSQTVCVNGITAIDICTNQSPGAGSCTSTYPASQNPVLICTATGGCGAPSYRWEYRTSTTGSWSLFAETSSASAPIGFINRTVGDYYIRCTITDECGNSVISQELTLVVFKTC